MRKQICIKKIAVTLIAAIFLLIGCETESNFFSENSYARVESVLERYEVYMEEEEAFAVWFSVTNNFGYGFYNPTFDPENFHLYEPFYGNLTLDHDEDALAATIANISFETHNFVFKVFLNYEEIPFRVLGEQNYVMDFVFTLEGGQQVEFPFVLGVDFPEGDVTYKLMAAIFVDPHLHAAHDDNELWFDAFANVVSVDVSFGNGDEINLSQEYNHAPLAQRINARGFGFDIWIASELYDMDSTMTIDYANLPVVQVVSGEILELAHVVNLRGPNDPTISIGDEDDLPPELVAENYVILALLDWQQIPLNGHPYLFVAVEGNDDENMTHYGRFTITVPEESGFYDFIAFVFPNADYRKTWHSFIPIQASFRFTIEVVEQ